jgi:hypothetical protein
MLSSVPVPSCLGRPKPSPKQPAPNALAMHVKSSPASCASRFRILCPPLGVRLRADNLLQLPLIRERAVELGELQDQLLARIRHRLLRRDLAVGAHAQLEGSEQRVRHLVGGEDDVRRLDELGAQEVGEGVVLLGEGEHGRIFDACGVHVSDVRSHADRVLALTGLHLEGHLLLAVAEQVKLVPVRRLVNLVLMAAHIALDARVLVAGIATGVAVVTGRWETRHDNVLVCLC